MAYGKNGATCWPARRSAHHAETGRVVGSCDEWRQHLCVSTKILWRLQDPRHDSSRASSRHKPASGMEHGVVISADDDLQDVEKMPDMGMSPIE